MGKQSGGSDWAPTDRGPWLMSVPWPNSHRVRVYDLAHRLEPGIPHFPSHPPYSFSLTKLHGESYFNDSVSSSAEMFTMGGHVGTHIDALGHVSRGGLVHPDRPIVQSQSYVGGIEIGSVDEMPPLLARGFLVDIVTHLGRPLQAGEAVGAELFDRWFEGQPDAPGPGDVVLVRTGWSRYWRDVAKFAGTTEGTPGIDLSGAAWLTDRRVVATGSDTIGYEVLPSTGLEVHAHLLVDHGTPIMESMDLDLLAAEQQWTFLFCAFPLPIKGGTASPIRPLAIVEAS